MIASDVPSPDEATPRHAAVRPGPGDRQGLSEVEAAGRLTAEGYNELPIARPRRSWVIALDVVREPMLVLLVVAGALYLVLGDLGEALLLFASISVILGITFYQERKTERALEALRDLSSPRALVIRGGVQRRVPGREVARGDLVVLTEGDRVPADAVLLESSHLSVDESLLTGESMPVRKVEWDGARALGPPGGDDQPYVYSGTLVVRGQGVARVEATGTRTALGAIGKALQTLAPEPTAVQQETARLVRAMALVAFAVCAVVVGVYGVTRADWVGALLAGITSAMSIIPEEFPVVLTVFLALGAWRLARQHVLTRRVPAVETLGEATVLCVDKTGTLTQNQLAVSRLWADSQSHDLETAAAGPLPEELHALVEFAVLASQRDAFDPVDRAIQALGRARLADTEHLHADWVLVREYPLSSALLALSHVWQAPGGADYVIAAKGAPEAIADLCHLSAEANTALAAQVGAMAAEGLRVLGVARAYFQRAPLPGQQHDFAFTLVGLVGLSDPVRPTVAPALRECYDAGLRVVMITGDYAGTARHVAQQVGLAPRDAVLSGPELAAMSPRELAERVGGVNVFARVVPEQKLLLVNALKATGEVVAMTGDGVNDAPALKAAHIGIAMGARGTDVAREAAALVLLDDDFASIVRAVELGRRIFDNLQKAMAYLLAVHLPIMGLVLLPVLLGWPLLFLPAHVVFLELIIDPACSIVFEAEPADPNTMRRRPRPRGERLFGRRTIGWSVLLGLSVLAGVFAVFAVSLAREQGEAEARALAFTTLIVANLSLILANRSWSESAFTTLRRPNAALWWVVGGALVGLALVLYVPVLRALFHFAPLHADDLALCLAAGVASIAWFEALKLWWRRSARRAGTASTLLV